MHATMVSRTVAIFILSGNGLVTTTTSAQPLPKSATPKFEVVSIKPCKSGDFRPGRGGGGGVRLSSGRITVNCETVADLIPNAYLTPVERTAMDPHFVRLLRQPVKGGPAWINSEFYRIEAKAEGTPSDELMRGPMMKALLEERFKLQTHRETRSIPVYALRVAKGGPKLQMAPPGSCVIVDRDHPFLGVAAGQAPPRVCGMIQATNGGLDTYGQTMVGLCLQLSGRLDREVIDKTGITGMFDFRLEAPPAYFFPEPSADGSPGLRDPSSPTPAPDSADVYAAVQGALQKLGLKLERTKGADEFLVVDRVEGTIRELNLLSVPLPIIRSYVNPSARVRLPQPKPEQLPLNPNSISLLFNPFPLPRDSPQFPTMVQPYRKENS